MDYEQLLLEATEESAASLAPTCFIGIDGWQGLAIDRLNNALGDMLQADLDSAGVQLNSGDGHAKICFDVGKAHKSNVAWLLATGRCQNGYRIGNAPFLAAQAV